MGGFGSGRQRSFRANETTSDYCALDIRRWQRDGLLTTGQSFSWQWKRGSDVAATIKVLVETNHIRLIYRWRPAGQAEWQDENYPVTIHWSRCYFGGERPWFVCPARGCRRRVAMLYGGGIFACRHCRHLTYACQHEGPRERAIRRAGKIRDKLGWDAGIFNPGGVKPKGMHWKTFERLTARHNAFAAESFTGMLAIFKAPKR